MSDGRKRILNPSTGREKRKAGNKTGVRYMPEERRQNLAETDSGPYYNQQKWLEEFLDNEGRFYNGSESGDSDNDDENYNKNDEQQQLSESFVNNCYKIVSPFLLQELINGFAVCKHCSGTILLVEDLVISYGFQRMWNFI